MDGPRYREEPLPAALNVRKKSNRSRRDFPSRRHLLWVCLVGALVWVAGSRAIKTPPRIAESEALGVSSELIAKLAGTQVEMAMAKLDQKRPDEALALMVSALEADPSAVHARALAERILRETTWNVLLFTMEHSMPIERVAFAAPESLWVSLGGEINTTVRWNLEDLRIENVLFPLPGAETRSLVIDPTHRRMVIERAGVTLLCDAQSLKPIKELGILPDFVTPPAVIVFSADGLLLAHPAFVSEKEGPLVWQIRDAASGEILRSADAIAADAPRPLAAFLDRHGLRVLHADASMLEIPVSPVDAARVTAAPKALNLLHAQFGAAGHAALVLTDRGPHRPPGLGVMPEDVAADSSLEATALLERFSWNGHPGIWSGLLRDSGWAPFTVDGNTLEFPDAKHAPLHAASAITAVAASGPLRVLGGEDGTLSVHRLLAKPLLIRPAPPEPETADGEAIAAFRQVSGALTGILHDEENLSFTPVDAAGRLRLFEECDFVALERIFPALDFGPVLSEFRSISPRTVAAEALRPLRERLDRTMPDRNGESAAARLALALDSERPEWIKECLGAATGMPPLLRKLAVSRIAWLEDRRADAMAGWPDEFPDLAAVRLREDWDGWEQVDFSGALVKFRLHVADELAAIELPENSNPAQRQEVFLRLTDPATLQAFGRQRLARACLRAALVFSDITEESKEALQLAEMARNLGAAPEPCLRVEAHSLATLGAYPQARDRWVLLLTEHPVETHESGDYAEAAYTAFESADPAQAMEILNTGLQRFPKDADFALRAGWIALLTGNADRAYRFLLTGREAGFPPEKLENATALMAIAAAQTGDAGGASAFFQDLVGINPAWESPETIEALEWPEELLSTLRQLTW